MCYTHDLVQRHDLAQMQNLAQTHDLTQMHNLTQTYFWSCSIQYINPQLIKVAELFLQAIFYN